MRIRHDAARNLLRLQLRRGLPIGARRPAQAAIDIGTGGRLLGLELLVDPALAAPWATPSGDPLAPDYDPAGGSLYVPISADDGGPNVRTALAEVALAVGGDGGLLAIDVPRRGHGYEISYPSGNR